MLIRAESTADIETIAELNHAAFGGHDEATLVADLRRANLFIASLVAVEKSGCIVGHILFTPVRIVSEDVELSVASLAPMAVLPDCQHRGIGSMLVREGTAACRRAGYPAIIVVGHREYYPRFGFTNAIVAHLSNPFSAGDAFMGLELVPGTLAHAHGKIVYPSAFESLAH